MKFLADENIPLEIVDKLKHEGIDIVSMSNISPGLCNKEVLSYAKNKRRILITFDNDFGKLIFNNKKGTHGIILLRFVPQTPKFIYSMLKKIFSQKIAFEKSFCVAETTRLRAIKL